MNCVRVPQILMPKEGTDLYKWSVIACDQYTSQPEYWKETEQIVGDAPSTLKLTLPEVYLDGSEEVRVEKIHKTMKEYMQQGILKEIPKGFVLVERRFENGTARIGLVAEIDLETYEYRKGEASLVRPTEQTVEERIPPRLKVRRNAGVELPHIMLLIDDAKRSILEPLIASKSKFQQVYDTDLMQNGGHISGWLIPEGEDTKRIMEQLERLADSAEFSEKYGLEKEYPLLNFAVGDGNHSMATAKAAWEEIKKDLSDEERSSHPARFCLCEIVNIHDESLLIEPIHRVLFQVKEEELLAAAKTYYEDKGCGFVVGDTEEQAHCFTLCSAKGEKKLAVTGPVWGIAAATIQNFLDEYLAAHQEAKIDYIHGEDVVRQLSSQPDNVGLILPEVRKEDLFIGVIKDGVLPRKTFSMGEANEKRYYMECKRIEK